MANFDGCIGESKEADGFSPVEGVCEHVRRKVLALFVVDGLYS